MKIEIKASPKEVKDGHFDYSNMESEYGCNTLYFTKTASLIQSLQANCILQDCRKSVGKKRF